MGSCYQPIGPDMNDSVANRWVYAVTPDALNPEENDNL